LINYIEKSYHEDTIFDYYNIISFIYNYKNYSQKEKKIILSYEDDDWLKERINFELEIPIDLYESPKYKNYIKILLSNKDNYIFIFTDNCVFDYKNVKEKEEEEEKEKEKEKEKENEKEININNSHTLEITFIIIGISLFLLFIIILVLCFRRMKKKSEENKFSKNALKNELNPIELNKF